jgi:hypothetical protein
MYNGFTFNEVVTVVWCALYTMCTFIYSASRTIYLITHELFSFDVLSSEQLTPKHMMSIIETTSVIILSTMKLYFRHEKTR